MDSILIEHLGKQERSLWRRHGVRLRIDAVTADGMNLLCCTGQLKRWFFAPSLVDHELVALAHKALMKLNLIGLRPLIAVAPRETMPQFDKMQPGDPFRLLEALHEAGSKKVIGFGGRNAVSPPATTAERASGERIAVR